MNQTRNQTDELAQARRAGVHFLVAVFGFSIFVNVLMLTGPLFMLQIYDRVLSSGSQETLMALFLLICGLYALMSMLDFARGRLMARFGARFQEKLDARVFSAMIERSILRDPRKSPTSELRDIETIQAFLSSPVILAMCDLPWVPIFFVAIFIFHPLLGWLGLAGAAVLLVMTFFNQWTTKRKIKEGLGTSAQAQNIALQSHKSSEVILSQGMLPHIQSRWLQYRDKGLGQTVRANDIGGAFTSVSKSFRLLLQSAMLAAGAYFVLQGELSPGAIIAGSILLGRGLQPIEQILSGWANIQRAIESYRDVKTLLSEMPQVPQRLGLSRPVAHLQLEGVGIRPPGADRMTLQQISFDLPPGEAVGIIGPSGSGKSTLGRAVTGLWHPVMGEIRLGGASLAQYDQVTLGQLLGYLPQNITLFPGTIAENIARMNPDPDDAEIERAARKAHAHDLITSLPQGYNTVLDGGDSRLSGGQRQRVALARAFYGDPLLLILDEPNSSLDAEGSEALNLAISDMKAEGKAVIIMTHRPFAIAQCDKLIVLQDGMMRGYGPRDEVLKKLVKNVPSINIADPKAGAIR